MCVVGRASDAAHYEAVAGVPDVEVQQAALADYDDKPVAQPKAPPTSYFLYQAEQQDMQLPFQDRVSALFPDESP